MGTNFYAVKTPEEECTYENHIGKRAAAGQYCWDCNQTFCKDGEDQIHHSKIRRSLWSEAENTEWYDFCPSCGAKPTETTLTDSSAGLELGFRKQRTEGTPTGVKTVCSFRWAKFPYEYIDEDFLVKNEYGDITTFKEFNNMLNTECPIHYYNSIGREFS